MHRIRSHLTTTLLIHVLLLLAALASVSDGLTTPATASTVGGGASPPSSRTGRLNPVAIGWRSALVAAHRAAIPNIPIVPPSSAAAFSGGLSLPPQKWHQHFFRKAGLTRLVPTAERRKGGRSSSSSSSSNRDDARPFGTRLVNRIKTVIAETATTTTDARSDGVGTAIGGGNNARPLTFLESMTCGAVSRSVSQTLTHPANAMKTILQSNRDGSVSISTLLARRENIHRLTRGAGAQLVLSLPQGAVNFAVLEFTKTLLKGLAERSRFGDDGIRNNGAVGATLDFLSSAASTVCCLVVSAPITVVTDNIMVGNYPDLSSAVSEIASRGGARAFYAGWRPQLASKIPSYGVTWVLFQRLKEAHSAVFHRQPTDFENLVLGSVASGATVSILMPLDTIKTRLCTQGAGNAVCTSGVVPYGGIADCAVRIMREEGGPGALYRGICPRLASVVPMVAIQFGVYEYMKRRCLEKNAAAAPPSSPTTEQQQQQVYLLGGTKIAKN